MGISNGGIEERGVGRVLLVSLKMRMMSQQEQ